MARSGGFSSTGNLGFAGRAAGSLLGDYSMLPDAYSDTSPESGYNPDAYDPATYGDPMLADLARASAGSATVLANLTNKLLNQHPEWTFSQASAAAIVDAEYISYNDEQMREVGWYPDPRNPGTYIRPEDYKRQTGRELTWEPTRRSGLTPMSSDAETQQFLNELMSQIQAEEAAAKTGAGASGGAHADYSTKISALDKYIANLRSKKTLSTAEKAKLNTYEVRRKEYEARQREYDTHAQLPAEQAGASGGEEAVGKAAIDYRSKIASLDRYIATLRGSKKPADLAKLKTYEARKVEYANRDTAQGPIAASGTGAASGQDTTGTGGTVKKDYSKEIATLDKYISNLSKSTNPADIAKRKQYEARKADYASR